MEWGHGGPPAFPGASQHCFAQKRQRWGPAAHQLQKAKRIRKAGRQENGAFDFFLPSCFPYSLV
jgi:hypothetical protein